MKVAQVIVKILEDEGITAAFGIPGAAINPIYKYLGQSKKITHYLARHEEGAVHAADGYYRASGKLAIAICTSGPGATNFVTGLYTAEVDSIPLIAITGQNTTDQFGKDAFQCVDIASIVKPVCKESFCITYANQVPSIMRKAFKIAKEGKPGPVLIDLPLDVQQTEIDYQLEVKESLPISKPGPSHQSIIEALNMLSFYKKPVLIMGGGVVLADAVKEFIKFAERLSLPVITTYMAKGAFPYDHALYVGQIGMQEGTPFGNKFFLESDLVLGIGCRFNDRHTGDLEVYTAGRDFIHIDIEAKQIGKIIPTKLGIVADAKRALQSLLDEIDKQEITVDKTERIKKIPIERERMKRKTYFEDLPIKPPRIFYEINRCFDDDTIFLTGCGLNQIWSGQFQNIKKPRHYLPSGGAGTLGFDIPAAIGAKVAKPEKKVVAVIGDGGFMFMVEELAMAAQYNISIIVIIINNGYLSLIRQNQVHAYNYEFGVNLWYKDKLVDFVKIAEGCGAIGEKVEHPEDIKSALNRAIDSNKPYVIDIIVERQTNAAMGPSINKIKENI